MATVLCLNSHKNPFPAAYCSSGVDLHIKIPRYFKAHKYRRPSCSPSISTSDEIQQRLSPVVNEINKEPNINSQLEDDKVNNIGVQAALSILSFYKREISPLLPRSCRYVPTCSEYSMIAYKKYGFVKGSILTAWRLCRCNPLGGSGFDPPRWFDEESPPEQ
ncbi:hypothetical protein Nepgr_028303 [Nepenthes gracilis]|uniref:Membrane protein insertion efficiency factor n=1 Tax=Nepenthes gracilis TaxID=150966 RepID=A0AAD3Y3T6_NEPGR|nr:hypothetical protein Nepgr_028303 [Nepenthes gracilis]